MLAPDPEIPPQAARPPEQPVETVDGDPGRGLLILCEHASNHVPEDLGRLGVPATEFARHIAYDIGAAAVTRRLAGLLGVPAVLTRFSRLIIDPNRGRRDPTLVMRLSDGAIVPGNAGIDAAGVAERIRRFYVPFDRAVDAAVARAEAAGLDEARVEAGDGRLEIRGVSRGLGVAELAATYLLSREAAPSADPPQPAHLAPREGLVCVDAQVAELARRLAGTPARPEAALKAFWSYMLDELCCGPVPYEQIDPRAPCDFVLRSGWYDCQLGAALFVALCRAVGVPARVVGGHVLYQKAPTNHFWAEAWLEGRWAPFDFLCFDLSLGGRDMAWRERFFGRLDARLIAERRPLEFTGAPGVRIPPVWRVLQTPEPDGARMELEGVDGAPVLSDLVSVRPAP